MHLRYTNTLGVFALGGVKGQSVEGIFSYFYTHYTVRFHNLKPQHHHEYYFNADLIFTIDCVAVIGRL